VARLLQGFSAGGEMGSATAFLTEYAPEHAPITPAGSRPASAWPLLGAAVGTFVTSSLEPEALASWGWRLPSCWASSSARSVTTSAITSKKPRPSSKKGQDRLALKEVIRNFPRETSASFSMVILWTVCTYLLFYMPTYSVKVLKLPQTTGFIAGMVGGLCIMVLAPIVGRLADRIGRRPLLSGAAALILVLAYPMFAYINSAPSLSTCWSSSWSSAP
jgi:MHS family proline/betaine transporter-like MFS transporter